MEMKALRAIALFSLLSPGLAGCGNGGGGDEDTDTAVDTVVDTTLDTAVDTGEDAPGDVPVDEGTTWRWCAKSCTSAEDCCLPGGMECGQYPNKWSCDEVCTTAGCDGDTECVEWATAKGLPGADGYKCRTSLFYWEADYCVAGCTTAEDCCPEGTDCSSYPQRRECDDSACKVLGCTSDEECRSWAGGLGLPDSADYECVDVAYSDQPTCAHPCTSTEDCCPGGSCGTFPNHVDCLAGHCLFTCTDDLECRDWAVSKVLPDPLDYVCHAFL